MKLAKILLCTALIMNALPSLAQVCTGPGMTNNNGNINCGKGIVDSLTVNGDLSLDGTTVGQNLIVNGNVEAYKATLNNVTVNGAIIATHSIITGSATVNNNEFTLTDSKVNNLIINNTGKEAIQVSLQGHTMVSGNITANGPVKLFISKHAKIMGTVSGAQPLPLPR